MQVVHTESTKLQRQLRSGHQSSRARLHIATTTTTTIENKQQRQQQQLLFACRFANLTRLIGFAKTLSY